MYRSPSIGVARLKSPAAHDCSSARLHSWPLTSLANASMIPWLMAVRLILSLCAIRLHSPLAARRCRSSSSRKRHARSACTAPRRCSWSFALLLCWLSPRHSSERHPHACFAENSSSEQHSQMIRHRVSSSSSKTLKSGSSTHKLHSAATACPCVARALDDCSFIARRSIRIGRPSIRTMSFLTGVSIARAATHVVAHRRSCLSWCLLPPRMRNSCGRMPAWCATPRSCSLSANMLLSLCAACTRRSSSYPLPILFMYFMTSAAVYSAKDLLSFLSITGTLWLVVFCSFCSSLEAGAAAPRVMKSLMLLLVGFGVPTPGDIGLLDA
mmetsp:Transcript_18434/g.45267  ORF Transcript_18434/g.45267 Transcript_18434/m.45267 type:complete len:326 (-) Transcript_18434:622-1599(-)